MGFESSASATHRLRRITDATRDVMLRDELLALIAPPADHPSHPLASARPSATSASGTISMHTPLSAASASLASWTGELTSADPGTTSTATYDAALAPQFPVDHLVTGLAYPDIVRALVASLAEHARVVSLVREAHALGAVTMPPEVAVALSVAANSIPAALRGGALPLT